MMRAWWLLAGLLVYGQDGKQSDQDRLPPSQKEPAKVFKPLTEDEAREFQRKREKFSVEPSAEPEAPPEPASDQEAQKIGGMLLPGGGYWYALRDKQTGRDVPRIVLPGVVGINSGFIEVFATLGPKDHESVLRVFCDVHTVDIAVSSILKVRRGSYPEKYGEADPSDASRILIFVQWKNDDGKVVTYRAEDLLIDVKHDRTFPRVGWVYLGQWHETQHPVTRREVKMLRAALSKLLVTTFRDPYSLIDNALKEEDATDDIFAANMFVLPSPGKNVSVILRKPTEEELKAIKKTEQDFYR